MNGGTFMEEVKNKVYIGARALSNIQLNKLLPNNKEIFDRINIIRNHATEYKKTRIKSNNIYENYLNRELDRNYNNVFSILGGRGSGKTSVLLTIKNKLTNKDSIDIMMPIIIPENMGEASDVLGWTICAFEKVIDNIERKVYEDNKSENDLAGYDFFKNCRKNDNNKLRRTFGEVLKYYTYINKEYRNILNVNYDGFNDYKEKTKDVVNAERELLGKFEEFIETIIDVKKCFYKNEDEKDPLIYIFFDDIDLCTERCLEIVNMILKYLSNPNIIVFVAGDYSTFSEALTINLLTKVGLLNNTNIYFDKNNEMGGKNALETRKILAQDILKKVLPPAYRFYMPTLNNKAKAEFVYSTKENDDKNYNSLVELINIKLMNREKEDKQSFLFHNNKLIEIYFNIFDSSPRGLINIYYFLYGLEKNEFIGEDEKISKQKKYYEILKEFLDIIIDSNPSLGDMRDDIYKIIDTKDIFINYDYLKELFKKELGKEDINYKGRLIKDNKSIIERYIDVFLLAHFIENLVVNKSEMDGILRTVHGVNIFIEMANMLNGNNLIPRFNKSEFILILYSNVEKRLGKLKNNDVKWDGINYFTNMYLNTIYDSMIEEETDKNYKNFTELLLKISRVDIEWVLKIINLIFIGTCKYSVYLIKHINEINGSDKINSFNMKRRNELRNTLNEFNKKYKDLSDNELYNKSVDRLGEYYNEESLRKLGIDELILENEYEMEFYLNDAKNIVIEVPERFNDKIIELIDKFNDMQRQLSFEKVLSSKLKEIKDIIENKKEISEAEFEEIKNIWNQLNEDKLNLKKRLNYDDRIIIDDLIENSFIKKIFDSADNEFDEEWYKDLIINNILLRTSIDIFERRNDERKKESYDKLNNMNKYMLELIQEEENNRKFKRLIRMIKGKKKMLGELNIEIEENKDV